jgi:hypothetical protein
MSTITLLKNVSVSRYEETEFNNFLIGPLTFEKIVDGNEIKIICSNTLQNTNQTVIVSDVENIVEAQFNIIFDIMGIQISGQTTVDYTNSLFNTQLLRMEAIADCICNENTDVYIRAAIPIDISIPFNSDILPSKADADLSLGNYQGWVLYKDPTVEDLNIDSVTPNNMWLPYYGDFSEIQQLNSDTINLIKSLKVAPLFLSDKTEILKFDYIWDDYVLIQDTIIQKKYDGGFDTINPTTIFTFDENILTHQNRLSIYLNGIYQLKSKIVIEKYSVDCTNLLPKIGDTITVILKAYSPTSDELNLDFDTNPVQLIQYVYNYQYTIKEIRNEFGQVTNTYYYFWVANKNLSTYGRVMSLQTAKNLLKTNTEPYAILQNISEDNPYNIPSYDQFIGVGLNRYITQDNTYKIRFTRDFILRDNPNNIDLKNVHTEWAMIREGQNIKIPETLWNRLVDAACGNNIAGDSIPSLNRIAYDERNGTSTRFGFDNDQAFVDKELAIKSIKYIIQNTTLTITTLANGGQQIPDIIDFMDISNIDELFSSSATIRKTMFDIWFKAKPKQINEIFFAVLYDALSANYEFSDIFKTSMIAAHSIRLFSVLGVTQ